MTPRYPANYANQGECFTNILVQPSQKLTLHIIEMSLEDKGRTDCADLLYFNDNLRSITLCGQRTNNSYSMLSNFLHIELQSSSGGRSKGFWLYYEGKGLMTLGLNCTRRGRVQLFTVEVTQNEDSDGKNSRDYNKDKGANSIMMSTLKYQSKSTVPLYRDSKSSTKQLPFAAIAGGVIGTLSLILAFLLLLLFIKWCKERKYYKAEKILEIKNPAFRSSNDFHETQSNSGYYC
ncbi:unnamed protein product [Lymnaea stagnalis]|uniref:CUB domain-containing protein n=1 Tax=Lymnaea stagnalis TaxID=6523 RepID=A0AAV2IT36_LYMST